MILIFSEQNTERLQYAAKFIFEERLHKFVQITEDAEEFSKYDGVKINYSKNTDLAGVWIYPAELLFEKGIREQSIQMDEKDGVTVLFPVSKGALSFDPFSSAFYMLSRYEEYLPFQGDLYGRFKAEDSLAFRNGFLQKPVVEYWIEFLKEAIQAVYTRAEFEKSSYKFTSTIDVDNAFAYRCKGSFRTLGGIGRDLWKVQFSNLKRRLAVILGGSHDPYDTFNLFHSLHQEYSVKPIYFFLLADYGHNDKSVPFSNLKFQSLVKSIADEAKVGIHPGFMSNYTHTKLPVEVARLQELTHREVVRSRQHYLMLNFPETYRRLIDAGIREEHSMGFASQVGFRAGTSMPFMFYDLDREASTPLKIVPFVAMDATLNRYMGMSPEEAIQELKNLRDEVLKVNGHFVTLWHNETLGEIWEWQGWRVVYEQVLKIGTLRDC